MSTYFVLMTSIFVNVYIISAIGDRLKEEVILFEQYQAIYKATKHALIAIDGLIDRFVPYRYEEREDRGIIVLHRVV